MMNVGFSPATTGAAVHHIWKNDRKGLNLFWGQIGFYLVVWNEELLVASGIVPVTVGAYP